MRSLPHNDAFVAAELSNAGPSVRHCGTRDSIPDATCPTHWEATIRSSSIRPRADEGRRQSTKFIFGLIVVDRKGTITKVMIGISSPQQGQPRASGATSASMILR